MKQLATRLLGMVVALWSVAAASQPPDPFSSLESTRYSVDRWRLEDGLPQTSVNGLAQDERGFIWVATFGGLARFDGRTFTRLGTNGGDLDGHRFACIAAQGTSIWAGTDRGRVFRFDDHGLSPPVEVPLGTAGRGSIRSIHLLGAGPSGPKLLIAAGEDGLVELDGPLVRRLGPEDLVADLVVRGADGCFWVAAVDQLEGVPSVGGAQCALRPQSLLESPPVGLPLALWDAPGGVSLATDQGHFRVERAPGQAPRVVRLPASPGYVAHFTDPDERWEAAPGGMLLRRDPLNVGVRFPGAGTSTPDVRSVLRDRSGALWVGTDSFGLFRIRDTRISVVGTSSGLDVGSVHLVLPMNDGAMLAAGYCKGLQRVQFANTPSFGRTARAQRVPGIRVAACVASVVSDTRDGAWVAVEDRLFHVAVAPGAGATAQEVTLSRPLPGAVEALLPFAGGLWVGTKQGLCRATVEPDGAPGRPARLDLTGPQLDRVSVTALAEDGRGGLLVGTPRGPWRLHHDGTISRLISESKGRPAVVRDFLVVDDGAWVATYGEGVALVSLPPHGAGQARWLDRQAGFCANEVSRFVLAGERLWINTNQGLFEMTLGELSQMLARPWSWSGSELPPLQPGCRALDTGEGNGGGHTAGGVLTDGRLVFPTILGVTVVDPSLPPPDRPTPALFVDRATVDGLPLDPEGVTEVPPGRRDVALVVMSPPDDEALLNDAPVVMALARNGEVIREQVGGFASTYVGLPPGDYELRAWRLGPAGPGSPVALRFRLQPAFGETLVAQVGIPVTLGAAVVFALWGVFRVLRGRGRALEAQLRERERADLANRERDDLYRFSFQGSPGPLFLFDDGGELRELNPAARRLVQWFSAEMPTGRLPFVPEGDRTALTTFLRGASVGPASGEVSVLSGNATLRVRLDAAPLRLGGRPHVLVAATDITAARDAERQRAELLARNATAQRLEGLGRLAAGVAHDFNNVLAALQLQVAELRARGGASVADLVGEMDEALRTGVDLSTRFLVFGKGDAQPATFLLDEAIAATRPLLGRLLGPGVELVVEAGAPGVAVHMPRVHLDRVLLNLVVNAGHAVAGNGRVCVRTQPQPPRPGSVQILPDPEGEAVTLEVEDTGVGMAAETLAKAFEPFFTTREPSQGTGLGLAVVHGIALRARAGIAAWSRPGEGTRFSLRFPAIVHRPAVTAAPAAPPVAVSGRTVLICDDTAPLRRSLARLFRNAGWTVHEAPDGATGRDLALAESLDLVVTDQVMPELSGVEFIEALRAAGRSTPVILMSGYPADARERLEDAGCQGVEILDKPTPPAELMSVAARLTRRDE